MLGLLHVSGDFKIYRSVNDPPTGTVKTLNPARTVQPVSQQYNLRGQTIIDNKVIRSGVIQGQKIVRPLH